MKTHGTSSEHLSDADLRTFLGAAAQSVFEAVVLGLDDYEITFAVGTLQRFADELARRAAERGDTRVYHDLELDAPRALGQALDLMRGRAAAREAQEATR